MRPARTLTALLVAASALSCTDGAGPTAPDGLSVQFSVGGPQAVSAAEQAALGAAFDQVDQYTVLIVDAITGDVIADVVVDLAGQDPDFHILDVVVPDDALGATVTITLVAFSNGVELYRSVTTTSLNAGFAGVQVDLEVRYTGPGVRGTVRDDSGDGLGGVVVGLYAALAMIDQVTTEDDGTYLFLDVPLGLHQVQPTAPPGVAFVCPGFRDVNVTTADEAIVANFSATDVFCGTSVLVLSGGDFDETGTVQTLLQNDPGLDVSTFFFINQTPGLAELSRHDVVLVFQNGLFDESFTLGNELAQYVALGGNLVIASFYWQGRSDSGQLTPGWGALETIDPFSSTGGATYQAGAINGNNIIAHPLTSGVTTLSSTGFWGGVAEIPGIEVVAWWADQSATPLVGYRILNGGQRIVGVSLFPASGLAARGDVQALWENAVNWAGAAGGPGLN